jgi:hypothetical protein
MTGPLETLLRPSPQPLHRLKPRIVRTYAESHIHTATTKAIDP